MSNKNSRSERRLDAPRRAVIGRGRGDDKSDEDKRMEHKAKGHSRKIHDEQPEGWQNPSFPHMKDDEFGSNRGKQKGYGKNQDQEMLGRKPMNGNGRTST